MSEIYFTIAGTNHWHGQEFIEPKMQVKCKRQIIRRSLKSTPPIMSGVVSGIHPESHLTMA